MKNELIGALDTLTEKEKNALSEAIKVIWLNDRSDYLNGLWDVVRAIIGNDIVDKDEFSVDAMIEVLKPFGD